MLPARRFSNQYGLTDLFNDFFDSRAVERVGGNTPAVNVIENDKEYKLEVAAPGMCKDDFQVHISKDGNLVIEMEKKCENKEGCKREGKYLRKEFSYAKFHQTLILPENAEKDNIEATVKDGVLHVRIPKLQTAKIEAEKRVIEVK